MSNLYSNKPLLIVLSCIILAPFISGRRTFENSAPANKLYAKSALTATSVSFQDVTLTNPINGATNVPVNTSISWTPSNVTGVVGYNLTIGTTPGGNDILSNFPVGLAITYAPPLGLPENTTIYITISLFFLGGVPTIPCPEQSFTTEDVTTPPPCIMLSSPLDGATGVPVGSLLTWAHAVSAEGYRITIGTTPGGVDIINNLDIGNVLNYNPPGDLPASTIIYVLVVPYNSNGNAPSCSEESFTTDDVASVLPSCTSLISPANGDSAVPLSSTLQWAPIGNADGYRMTVGSTPFSDDILADQDLGNVTSISFLNFVPNSLVFVTIIPYNAAGEAIGCVTESFSTILGCGPFVDPNTGELVFLGPELSFPDTIGLCLDQLPFVATATTGADGYRWFSIDSSGSESLVSSENTFDIFQEGQYRLEAFNLVDGSSLECSVEQLFTIVASEAPIITSIDIQTLPSGTQVTVVVTGNGDYEFALNNPNGPYQASPIFIIDPSETNRVYVRDRNGCGITERFINSGLPNFFTPNGDNINDFWQVPGAVLDGEAVVSINIFDRFGKLLTQLDPQSQGWDGNYVGNPMPSSDYWYSIQVQSGRIFKGHFALKR